MLTVIKNIFYVLFMLFTAIFNLNGQNTICEGQFSTYNFDIPGSPTDQILTLHELGIQVVIFNTNNNINSYLQSPLVQNGEFKIDVVYHRTTIVHREAKLSEEHMSARAMLILVSVGECFPRSIGR